MALLCSCPFILFSEQENSCTLSSNGLFSTINLFFSLLFPSKMTQIILAFCCSEYCNALSMLQATAQRTHLACTRVFKWPTHPFSKNSNVIYKIWQIEHMSLFPHLSKVHWNETKGIKKKKFKLKTHTHIYKDQESGRGVQQTRDLNKFGGQDAEGGVGAGVTEQSFSWAAR